MLCPYNVSMINYQDIFSLSVVSVIDETTTRGINIMSKARILFEIEEIETTQAE